MPLAAISRMSSSAACRLARGSLWGAQTNGGSGACVQCYAAPELSLVQSSSRAAKCPQSLSIGVAAAPAAMCLNAHHFADPTPRRQQQSQVTGRQLECVVVMAGVCWSELQYSSRAPPESLQLLCDGWGLEPVSTDVWAAAAGRWPLHGGSGPRSGRVSLPRHRAAPGTSTHAPQWANKSKPTMHSSLMSASQNSWCVWLIPTTTDNSFFPGITVLSPVTVSSAVLVGVQSSGRGPAVPDNSPFRSKHMVDPVSTRALQGCPPTTQSRYSPLASPQRPTIGQSWWRGDKERGEGPLTASLRGRFPVVTLSRAGGSEQDSPWQSAPVLRSENSGLIWTSVGGSPLVGPG